MPEIGTKIVDVASIITSPITSLISKVTTKADEQGTANQFLENRPVMKAFVKGAESGIYFGGAAATAVATYGIFLNAFGPWVYIGAVALAAVVGFIIGVAIKYYLDSAKDDLDAKNKADTEIKENIGKIEQELKTRKGKIHDVVSEVDTDKITQKADTIYSEDKLNTLKKELPNAKTRQQKEALATRVSEDLKNAQGAKELVLDEIQAAKLAKKKEDEEKAKKIEQNNTQLIEMVKNQNEVITQLQQSILLLMKKMEANSSNSGSNSTTASANSSPVSKRLSLVS